MALLIIGGARTKLFANAARALDPSLDVRIWPDAGRLEDITYALAWLPPPGVLKTLPNLELIVSVGAGVDHLFLDPQLPDVPVVRYVDPDLTARMAEYIALQVLFHQRRMSEFLELQRSKVWEYRPEPAAHEVRVGIMGLGVMGVGAAHALSTFRYQLRGWSRSAKTIAGVETFSGADGLDEFLAGTDILTCVLPYTKDTHGILNRDLFRKLSRSGRHSRLPGPVLINAGRGGLQVETDILAALNSGELYAASLDVFQTEPLPSASRLWTHPRVVVTPHNAAESKPESIIAYTLRQLARHRSGQTLENLVSREQGY